MGEACIPYGYVWGVSPVHPMLIVKIESYFILYFHYIYFILYFLKFIYDVCIFNVQDENNLMHL